MKTLAMYFVLCLALCAGGCGKFAEHKQAADQGVADFHQLYNAGQFPELYAASHATLKNVTSEAQFLDLLGKTQNQLGKVTKTANVGFNIQTINTTTTVVLNQQTTYEHGTAREVFTFEIFGNKAVLLGYNIESE